MFNNKKETTTKTARLFCIGLFMGTADLVPGVSGGTVALLCGIYNKLLLSIKTITGEVLRLLLKREFNKALALTPLSFLLPLGLGIATAVFSLAAVLAWLLNTYPIYVESLFFGLVLASAYAVISRTTLRSVKNSIGFFLGILAGAILVNIVPIVTPDTGWMVFLSGAIAISAMILPGISGSFMLLIMGQYSQILTAIKDFEVVTLSIFALGCILGLSFFSRFLSWLLNKHYPVTIAVLAGIMLGSIKKLWPWKETLLTRINSHGIEIPLVEKNVLPLNFDTSILFALLFCAIGISIVLYIHFRQKRV